MNISCRIANADTQCGRITNPPERMLTPFITTHIAKYPLTRIMRLHIIVQYLKKTY